MDARKQLAEGLAQILPATWDIHADGRTIDNPDPATPAVVSIDILRLEPAPTMGARTTKFNVWLLEPSRDLEQIETNLGAHLDLLLNALDGAAWLIWETAERGLFQETFHAYRVEVTTMTPKGAPTP